MTSRAGTSMGSGAVRIAGVQIGQIWRSNDNGEIWLVTKTYSELFTSYAVLRKIGGKDSDVRRVKVERSAQGQVLTGFSLVEEPA